MVKGWRRKDHDPHVHVLPLDDTREHVERADCWCGPKVEKVETNTGGWGYVVTHKSADGRELLEPGRIQ